MPVANAMNQPVSEQTIRYLGLTMRASTYSSIQAATVVGYAAMGAIWWAYARLAAPHNWLARSGWWLLFLAGVAEGIEAFVARRMLQASSGQSEVQR
jgi:hypothetical protein